MAECKRPGCNAPIKWAKRPGHKPHEANAFVALDPDPRDDGIYALVNDRVVLWDPATPKDAVRYMPHAATCSAQQRLRRPA